MRKNSRHGPLTQALGLIVELRRRRFGMDYKEIIAHLGCSRRNMYRYLKALEDAGVKLHWGKEPGGSWQSGRHSWNRVIRLISVCGYKLTEHPQELRGGVSLQSSSGPLAAA